MTESVGTALRVSYAGVTQDFADGPVTVGRGRDSHVVVSHEDASRRHLEFRRYGAEWQVADLGSTNGTFVNGVKMPLAALTGRVAIGVGNIGARVDVEVVPVSSHPAAGQFNQPASQQPSQQPNQPGTGQFNQPSQPQPSGQAWTQSPIPETWQQPSPVPQLPPGHYAHGHTIVPSSATPGGGALSIGRTRTNDIVVSDALVSRQHATLTLGQPAILRDLNSFNGTFVNGQRLVGETALNPGDEVMFGNQTFMWDGGQLTSRATRSDYTLFVDGLTTVVSGGKRLLDSMSFALEPASLTAVIGPSGAGKSTLLGALTGNTPATHGHVIWQGHDLYTHYDQLRFQIGLVPQQDIQHPQLTVRQGLAYAAELRLPPDTAKDERDARVQQVVGQMQLDRQIDNRIGTQLSGGQKKRVSIATELLTAPPLLFLDEPTSGLDPGLDRDVMLQLRQLADEGRVVMVVTHSVLALDACDNVVVLAPGGKLAYFGPPSGVLAHFGVNNYPEVFDLLDEPDLWQRIPAPPDQLDTGRLPAANGPVTPPPKQSLSRQFSTLIRRNLAVTAADKLLLAMLVLMPLVLGGLSRVVQGGNGLGLYGDGPTPIPGAFGEATQRLTILITSAALMGTAITIRELVKERAIFQREYAVGLSSGMYLFSKIAVLGTAAFLQGVLLTWLATVGMPGPDDGGVFGLGWVEVAISVGFMCFVMAALGLTVSALVTSSEQTMPVLVGLVVFQLVFSGALVEVAGRAVLEQVAWLAPGRWAYAAAGGSVGFNRIDELTNSDGDPLMTSSPGVLFADLFVMMVLCAAIIGLGFWLVRRSATSRR